MFIAKWCLEISITGFIPRKLKFISIISEENVFIALPSNYKLLELDTERTLLEKFNNFLILVKEYVERMKTHIPQT